MSSPILEVRNVYKNYEEGRIEALRGVDMSIDAGEFVAISGHSGSGKSTLLHLLGGLDTPTSGSVLFRGQPLDSSFDLDRYRCEHVGFVFQAFYLLPTLRAIENVQAPMLALRNGNGNRAQRAETLLREMGMEHRMDQHPNKLSAGERQRVAIARALANQPEILLADEPTGNLDSANSARIMEILTGIQKSRGMTLIVVTHEEEIASAAPRHIRIHDGKVAP
ncbi:MAG TPA: ABC transporter ATP-binding protein [Terracidiphilus sp.]|nr:ABC transporter ATP-binding protein [Terracidiphilus sp.]